jgi:hypothetical protein
MSEWYSKHTKKDLADRAVKAGQEWIAARSNTENFNVESWERLSKAESALAATLAELKGQDDA